MFVEDTNIICQVVCKEYADLLRTDLNVSYILHQLTKTTTLHSILNHFNRQLLFPELDWTTNFDYNINGEILVRSMRHQFFVFDLKFKFDRYKNKRMAQNHRIGIVLIC